MDVGRALAMNSMGRTWNSSGQILSELSTESQPNCFCIFLPFNSRFISLKIDSNLKFVFKYHFILKFGYIFEFRCTFGYIFEDSEAEHGQNKKKFKISVNISNIVGILIKIQHMIRVH